MVIVIAALLLSVLLGALFLIPRDRNAQKVQLNPINKVYDVTSYVEEHPGGDAILTHAGDDSTEGFYGPQHATRVFDMIEDFYIGDLKL